MKKAVIVLENCFEDIEALGTNDVLRRGGVDVKLVSVSGGRKVKSDRGVVIETDELLGPAEAYDDIDVLIVPGGPAYMSLRKNAAVLDLIRRFAGSGRLVASVCAGPLVLEKAGILANRKWTCYPGMGDRLGALNGKEIVCRDGNIITSRGPATSLYFGLAILEALGLGAEASGVKEGMLVGLTEEALLSE